MPTYAGRSEAVDTFVLPSTKELPLAQQCKVWGPKELDFPTRAALEDACCEWITETDEDGDETPIRVMRLAKLLEQFPVFFLTHKQAGWNLKKPQNPENPDAPAEDWERDEETLGLMLKPEDYAFVALELIKRDYPQMLGLPSADPNASSGADDPPSKATSEAESTASPPKTAKRTARSKQPSSGTP